jgi:anti-anti-sigma factor
MGLGVIVGAIKRARAHDGELVLAGANERITHVLTLSRVAEIVRVADAIDEVLPTT